MLIMTSSRAPPWRMLSPPSTPIAGPSTQDDLARLLELAGTPVRPGPTAQPASADFFRPAPLTPSVAREAACQAEAGTTPPCVVSRDRVAARKSGPVAVVHSAQGKRRCDEPLLPLLAQGEGRPHRPTEHALSDTRLLCASVCSAVLETTTTKQYRPEGLRARIVAFALVAAVAFLAVFVLGTRYAPAPTRLPPPPATIIPSPLDSSHQPPSKAATGHNATGHKRAGSGAGSPPPQDPNRHASGKASGHAPGHEPGHESGQASGQASGSGSGSGASSGQASGSAIASGQASGSASASASGQAFQREPQVPNPHPARHKQDHARSF